MASSYRDKAGRRAERMVAAIRDALRQGNGNKALTEACAPCGRRWRRSAPGVPPTRP